MEQNDSILSTFQKAFIAKDENKILEITKKFITNCIKLQPSLKDALNKNFHNVLEWVNDKHTIDAVAPIIISAILFCFTQFKNMTNYTSVFRSYYYQFCKSRGSVNPSYLLNFLHNDFTINDDFDGRDYLEYIAIHHPSCFVKTLTNCSCLFQLVNMKKFINHYLSYLIDNLKISNIISLFHCVDITYNDLQSKDVEKLFDRITTFSDIYPLCIKLQIPLDIICYKFSENFAKYETGDVIKYFTAFNLPENILENNFHHIISNKTLLDFTLSQSLNLTLIDCNLFYKTIPSIKLTPAVKTQLIWFLKTKPLTEEMYRKYHNDWFPYICSNWYILFASDMVQSERYKFIINDLREHLIETLFFAKYSHSSYHVQFRQFIIDVLDLKIENVFQNNGWLVQTLCSNHNYIGINTIISVYI